MNKKKIKACFHTNDIECENCKPKGKMYEFDQIKIKLFEPDMEDIPPEHIATMEVIKVEGGKVMRLVQKPNGNYHYVTYQN